MDLDYAMSYTSDPYAEIRSSDTDMHSDYGYEHPDNQCCPLVVDFLCLASILGAIAGATVLISRLMIIELCMIMGVVINDPCPNPGRRRRRRSVAFSKLVHEGKKEQLSGSCWSHLGEHCCFGNPISCTDSTGPEIILCNGLVKFITAVARQVCPDLLG